METLIANVTNESRWILPTVILAVAVSLASGGRTPWDRRRVAGAMTLFSGLLIGVLALGHLVAVLVKQSVGTLNGASLPLYAIGLVLAGPAALVLREGWAVSRGRNEAGRRTATLHGMLALALVVTGPLNLPLAVPSLLAAGYSLHRRRAVGLIVGTAMVLVVVLLTVGSARFFASGQSFESFSGTAAVGS